MTEEEAKYFNSFYRYWVDKYGTLPSIGHDPCRTAFHTWIDSRKGAGYDS